MIPPVATIDGRRVLFAMATEQEYGPHLRRLFRPLITGVGPVEAAITTATALARLEAQGRMPDLVVCLGSAGSRILDHARVYQVKSVAWRDMDASPLGFARGVTPFSDLPAVIDLPCPLPGVPEASLSTGGNIITGAAYDTLGADMADMETWAVAVAGRRAGLPVVGLRGISDGRQDLTGLHDWTEYLHEIDERLAEAVGSLAAAIKSA